MVHLNGGVADTRGSRIWACFPIKREVPKSTNRGTLTEYLIVLAVILVDMMDSSTNKRKETNINARVV